MNYTRKNNKKYTKKMKLYSNPRIAQQKEYKYQ